MRCRVITCAIMYDVMSRLIRPQEIFGWGVDVASEEKKLNSKKDICSILCLICFIIIRQLGTFRIVCILDPVWVMTRYTP